MADDLQTQLEALRAARATGARRVRYRQGDVEREVEYRSDAELQRAIADIEQRIATPRRVVNIAPSKGL